MRVTVSIVSPGIATFFRVFLVMTCRAQCPAVLQIVAQFRELVGVFDVVRHGRLCPPAVSRALFAKVAGTAQDLFAPGFVLRLVIKLIQDRSLPSPGSQPSHLVAHDLCAATLPRIRQEKPDAPSELPMKKAMRSGPGPRSHAMLLSQN